MNSLLVLPIFSGGISAVFTVDTLSLHRNFFVIKYIPMAHLKSIGNSKLV